VNWTIELVLILIGAGACIGFLSGLLGLGGAILTVPLFVFLLNLQGVPESVVIKLSFGSALLTGFLTASSGNLIHRKRSQIKTSYILIYALSAATAAFFGGLTATHLRPSFLYRAFGIVLVISALAFPFRRVKDECESEPFGWKLVPLGLVIGYSAALVGVGGALFTVLVFGGLFRYCIRHVASLSVLEHMFSAAFACTAYAIGGQGVSGLPPGSVGFVNVPLATLTAAGSIPMALLGARMTYKLPPKWTSIVFSILLILLSLRFLLRSP
jgi:uncharacterized membrane protein YfcA